VASNINMRVNAIPTASNPIFILTLEKTIAYELAYQYNKTTKELTVIYII
jgi:hypothetical protein